MKVGGRSGSDEKEASVEAESALPPANLERQVRIVWWINEAWTVRSERPRSKVQNEQAGSRRRVCRELIKYSSGAHHKLVESSARFRRESWCWSYLPSKLQRCMRIRQPLPMAPAWLQHRNTIHRNADSLKFAVPCPYRHHHQHHHRQTYSSFTTSTRASSSF